MEDVATCRSIVCALLQYMTIAGVEIGYAVNKGCQFVALTLQSE